MRHISFFLTQEQVKRRQKDVTRRTGWAETEVGDLMVGVVKGQGIKKGERIEPLCIIEVVKVSREPLDQIIRDPAYGYAEMPREGFPNLRPVDFTVMYRDANGGAEDQPVTRIQFRYREDLWESYKAEFKNNPTPTQPQKEVKLAKDKTTEKDKPAKGEDLSPPTPDEAQALGEKDAIDKAFSAPVERAGMPSDQEFSEAIEAAPATMPADAVYMQDLDPNEALQSFQKVVFVPFTENQFATKGKEIAAMDGEIEQLEVDMKAEVKEWKDKIDAAEGRRRMLSAAINSKGEEREIECRKRINEKDGTATIFDAASLQIIETRKLTNSELQTELRFLEQYRAARDSAPAKPPRGSNIVEGKFPKEKMIGATAVESPEADAKNEAALKALAKDKK